LVGLAVLTALAGIGVRAWAPGFDAQVLQAIAGGRDAMLTSIAWVVTEAGSFVLLAPLSIAFLLLRRWKRPADDVALLVIAVGSAVLPFVVKLIVARPRPTIEHLSHLSSLSFPSEHTTQAAAIYLAIAILLSQSLTRGWPSPGHACTWGFTTRPMWSPGSGWDGAGRCWSSIGRVRS